MALFYLSSNKYSTHERKLKNGKTVYDICFRITTVDGANKQKWVRGFTSKTLAKQGYLDFVERYCEYVRQPFRKKKDPTKEVPTVGELIRQYMATLGNQNKQSVIYDKGKCYDAFVLPYFKDTTIDKLTKEELYQWQDKLYTLRNPRNGDYFSHKYLLKIHSHFSAFLSWVEQRYGYKNNLAEVVKPKARAPKTEIKFWTREQFDVFISVVDDPTYHALFTFMFFTGRRKGELFALYKTDVKRDKITYNKSVNRRTYGLETWEITTTKADKVCTLPICAPVKEEIKRYKPPAEGQFYFGGKQPLAPATVERKFKYYTEKAGLPKIRIHDLRHSFVSMLIHETASAYACAFFISDTVEMVLKTYGHLYESDALNIIGKIK